MTELQNIVRRQRIETRRDTHVNDTDEEAPPSGEDKEASSVVDTHGRRIVVLVVISDERRSNHTDDESDEGEYHEGDGVTPADEGGTVNHDGVLQSDGQRWRTSEGIGSCDDN